MPHVLVATDLSPRADRAVERAFRIAAEHDANLTALSIVDEALPKRLASPLLAEAEALLHEFCDAQPTAGDVSWSARVDQGDPAEDVHNVAEAIGADLVVLGLHRRRALLDTLRETTLERIARGASQPVLLVADRADHAYTSVVAAIDFSPAATAALSAVRQWAPDASIHAFHAVNANLGHTGSRDTDPGMAKAIFRDAERMRDQWAETGLPENVPRPEIIDGAFAAVFSAECQTFKPQLVAIGAHARHGFARRVLGGVARELVRHPPCDLLVGRPI